MDLKQTYLDHLTAMIEADRLSLEATKAMRDAAHDDALVEGLENAVCGISDGLDIVRDLANSHACESDGTDAPGMTALVEEARASALEADFDDDQSRDAAILLHFQRFTHFGLTSYAILARMANVLELPEDAERLQEGHSNAQDGDDEMAEVADKLLAPLVE